MKRNIFFVGTLCLLSFFTVLPVNAANNTARTSVRANRVGSAKIASIQQYGKPTKVVIGNHDEGAEDVEPEKDMREKEKMACLANNIGLSNTFVWASKYSDVSNYSMMVEDTENPENNVCFTLVGIKSNDDRIDTSDISKKYFAWGQNVTCGSWVDKSMMENRIADAKKKARTWATVAGGVGGAGIGVGAMELFGNKLIDGKVEGQKNTKLTEAELLHSQLGVLKKENPAKYSEYESNVKKLKAICEKNSDMSVCKEDKAKLYMESI